MPSKHGRVFPRYSGYLLVFFLALSCSDAISGPTKALAPLVGIWDARVFEIPNPENLLETVDVIQEGGSYAFSVLGDGQYTAVFDLVLLQGFEVGTIQVTGQNLILTPTSPAGGPMSGTWMFEGDVLIVDALREFDISQSGEPVLVPLYLELVARES
jgi:hypothetical protein